MAKTHLFVRHPLENTFFSHTRTMEEIRKSPGSVVCIKASASQFMQFASAARRYFHTQTITNEPGERALNSNRTSDTTGLFKVRERTEEKHTDPKPAAPSRERMRYVWGECQREALRSGRVLIW